ncbi:MBL fold metallo-hydrolase [Phormidium sp. CCY1219]|uniref:MBL fold metallo-hydrolase n=1 Tax=Phormidium sp. CCY1219 TaxID=2886104 RepID=UPI002D1E7331|nr:MBL fold metallo-hydrolase [Phormidium sp. CCY1219]MEB3828935.1 MBL fold metallo-hydrolase [Phormidium sp. CCY1219]
MELECLAYSVGHADEGVCLLVRIGPYRILLDCGLADIAPLQVGLESNPEESVPLPADLVLVSNAHRDRARGVWPLHQAFPQLPIYASEVTTQLLHLNWPEVEREAIQFCQALPWRTPIEILNGLTAELFPAGHLPGAATLRLTYSAPDSDAGHTPRPYTVVYTGDFFLSNTRLVEGLPLEELRGLDPQVLIVEGSYGTSRFPHRRSQENQLAERIDLALDRGQSVLLPTPTLGLGQELLMLLRSHHHFTGREIDIWVDGSIADACDVYLELLPQLPTSVRNFAKHQPLFWDERIRPRVRRIDPENRPLLGEAPCIVLTDLDANLQHYCQSENRSWLVLLPEYPGQSLEHGPGGLEAIASVEIQVESYLLPDRCDGNGTTQLIHNLHPQHVIFVHGSPAYLADLTNLDELRNRYHLHTPEAGTLVELPIGETFLQPATPAEIYEGELSEQAGRVTFQFTDAIAADPRWQNFADTGLLEARWQGEELVVRGVSQREVLSQGSAAKVSTHIDCCGNCRYYRGQRCWNQASPLFGFKVTPEGYCPAFEAAMVPPLPPDNSPTPTDSESEHE